MCGDQPERQHSNVTFIHDFSRHTWIFPMWQKSEVFSHFEDLENEVEKATGEHVRFLWSDGSKAYFSDAFTTYLREEGIRQEFTCHHTPQKNGEVKGKNQHILQVARAMLNEKIFPKSYWVVAENTVVYLMNLCTILPPTRSSMERNRTYPTSGYSAILHLYIFPTKRGKTLIPK